MIMRDLKSRAFGSEWGFLFTTCWPLVHIVLLILINAGAGRAAPYGESSALWFASGVIPFMAFSYVSRFTVLGVVMNRSSMMIPIVKMSDLLLARIVLEVLSTAIVVIVLIFAFWVLGIDFTPVNLTEAFYALFASIFLGIGFGVLNGIVGAFLPMWVTGYFLSMIILWIASGVLFVPDALPQAVQDALSYNPALQCVEWMRSAYYEGYGSHILNKPYVLWWGGGTLLAGLLGERLFRGKILSG